MENSKKLLQIKLNVDENEYTRFIIQTSAIGMTPADFLTQLIADWTYGKNAGKQCCHDAIENYCSVAGFSYDFKPSLIQYVCDQFVGTDELNSLYDFIKSMEDISRDEKELVEVESLAKQVDSGYTKEDVNEAKECLKNDREYFEQLCKEFAIENFCKKNNLNEKKEVEKLKQWYYMYWGKDLENCNNA